MSESRDLLGNEVTASEQRLLDVYVTLCDLNEDPDLAPTAKANVAEALASIWQALNNLALTDERPAV